MLIFFAFAAFFMVAGLTVKTFRYKYGGFKVPRVVGGLVCAGFGVLCIWIAIALALKP